MQYPPHHVAIGSLTAYPLSGIFPIIVVRYTG